MEQRNALAGYLFILPFLIGFFAFMFYPIFQSFLMVFNEVKIDTVNHDFSLVFTGLANLNRVFLVDPEFNRMLTEEIGRMVLSVPAILIFSLFIAVLLNQKFKGRGIIRAIFFLPVILYSGVIIGIERNNAIINAMMGLLQEENAMKNSITETLEDILLSSELLGGDNVVYNLMKYTFMIVNQIYDIAMSSGIQIIIFLSGLQTISPSVYEAAEIEGAAKWECFWKITFPMVSPLILVNVVYSVIDFFLRSDSAIMIKIRTTIVSRMEYGFTSAMAWVYFLSFMIILGITSLIISRKVYYYE